MATAPSELSIAEIRKYMLSNDSKVTNHSLVKHFKHFLTKPETQSESLTNVHNIQLPLVFESNTEKHI